MRVRVPFALTTLAGSLLVLGVSPVVWAQTAPAPTAGDVLRSVTPPLQPVAPAERTEALRPAPQAASPTTNNSILVPVKRIEIKGVTVLSEPAVRDLLSDLVGRSWTVGELNRAVQRITRYYHDKGYPVARAVLPAQDVRDGVIEVLVLEGRVGRVEVTNQSLLSDATVARLLGDIPLGSVVQGNDLETRLLTLGDTPGTSRATVLLQPGAQTGETDLQVNVEPAPRVTGQLDADNHGNRYTGTWRVGAQVFANSLLGWGDQLSLRALLTEESVRNLRVGYRVPVGRNGWNVGAAFSQVDYTLAREYAALQARGWSQVGSLDVGTTLSRTPGTAVNARLGWDHKVFEDRIEVTSPVTVNRKQSDVVSATLTGYRTRTDWNQAWTMVLSRGKLNLPTDTQVANDTASTRGYFNKAVLTANLNANLKPGWSVFGAVTGQVASQNLDAAEKFAIAGVNGVRAYPEGEALGDQGVLGTAEVRYTLPLQPVQLGAFVDSGYIRRDRRVYTTDRNSRTLTGAGLSLTWAPTADIGIKLIGATRLGQAKVESEPSDDRTRFWVQSQVRF